MTDLDTPDLDDLDARIADLLARSAGAVDIRLDLDGVTREEVVVRLTDRPARTRRHLALAAAAAALLVVVGAVAIAARAPEPTTTEQAAAPGPDDLFPVLGDGPSEDDGGTTPTFIPLEEGYPTDPVQAVIGRSDGESVSDLVLVQVPAGDLPARDAVDGTPTTVAGRPAWADDSDGLTTIAIETDPVLLVTGRDGMPSLLDELGPEALVPGRDATGQPTLEVGPLPPGLALLTPPRAFSPDAIRTVEVEAPAAAPDAEWVAVSTMTDDPLDAVVRYGSARRVSVDGATGWSAEGEDGATVAWRAANGTTVTVDTREGTAEDALALARSVRLVDEATWRATYDVTEEDTAPTTGVEWVDPIGQPAPEVAGRPVGDDAPVSVPLSGRWTVVAVVDLAYEPSEPVLTALAEYAHAHPDGPELVTLTVENTAEDIDAYIAEGDVGWPVVNLSGTDANPWTGTIGVPSIAIVDPDGIVRTVLRDGIDAAAIATALDDLDAE